MDGKKQLEKCVLSQTHFRRSKFINYMSIGNLTPKILLEAYQFATTEFMLEIQSELNTSFPQYSVDKYKFRIHDSKITPFFFKKTCEKTLLGIEIKGLLQIIKQ